MGYKKSEKKTKEIANQLISEEITSMGETYIVEKTLENICEIGEKHLVENKEKAKCWMMDEILQLMERRRKSKKEKGPYNYFQKQIRK